MKIASLGIRSDLFLLDAEISDQGDFLMVRSPKEPGFYWGNLLVFSEAPTKESLQAWPQCFEAAFAAYPEVAHKTFIWDRIDDAPGDIAEFVARGYRHEKSTVLTASAVHPPPYPKGDLRVERVNSDAQWEEVIDCLVLVGHDDIAPEDYRRFLRGRIDLYRERSERGLGTWYLAYLPGDEQAAGTLGVFVGEGIGRFQQVGTRPDARGQGVCGNLVFRASQQALAHEDVQSLVLVADPDYHAARIYESVGFAATECIHGLSLWPES